MTDGSIYGGDIYSAGIYSWLQVWMWEACQPVTDIPAPYQPPPSVAWAGGPACAPLSKQPPYQPPASANWRQMSCQPVTQRGA